MIDLDAYTLAPIVLACLVVGYIIKTTPILSDRLKNLIPLIVAILGALLASLEGGFNTYTLTAGAISGLLSTGLYEAFKGIINGND